MLTLYHYSSLTQVNEKSAAHILFRALTAQEEASITYASLEGRCRVKLVENLQVFWPLHAYL